MCGQGQSSLKGVRAHYPVPTFFIKLLLPSKFSGLVGHGLVKGCFHDLFIPRLVTEAGKRTTITLRVGIVQYLRVSLPARISCFDRVRLDRIPQACFFPSNLDRRLRETSCDITDPTQYRLFSVLVPARLSFLFQKKTSLVLSFLKFKF